MNEHLKLVTKLVLIVSLAEAVAMAVLRLFDIEGGVLGTVLDVLILGGVSGVFLYRWTGRELKLRAEKEGLFDKVSHRNQLILESVAEGIYGIDLEGKTTFANRASTEITGFSPEEILTRSTHELFHYKRADGSAYPREECRIYATSKDGKTRHVSDEVFWRKDGTPVPVEYMASPIMEGGKRSGVVVIFKDISERLKELKLRAEKQALFDKVSHQNQLILEAVAEGIYGIDLEGKTTFANRASTEITGFSPEEILARSTHELFHYKRADGSAYPREECRIYATSEDGKTRHVSDEVFWRKDGTPVPVEYMASPVMEGGKRSGVVVIFKDISERLKAQRELEYARRYAEHIYQIVPSAVFTIDKERRITSWNRKAAELTGFSVEEALGKDCGFFMPESRAEERGLGPENVIQAVVGKECRIRHKDGRIRIISKNVDLLTGPDGEITGGFIESFIESFEDITERKTMEEELHKAREAAEAAARAKSDFLAHMSHEVRTPMNAIIGMTGLLLDTELDSTQRDYATVVKNAGEGLLEIVNDILDFSKMGAGKMSIEVLDFDLRDAVEGVVELVAPHASEKGIEVASSVESEVPVFLRGDVGRIRQILLNLLSNAVKFTERGEVVLRVAGGEETGARTLIRFEVRDSGIGISPEGQRALFHSFAQADVSTTRKYGGTGLGLAISKKLVEMMGGSIGVQSEPGKGSTFFFSLPLEVQQAPVPAPERKDLEAIRVLVVDDNAANREIVRRQLASWKMEAEAVVGGAEALDRLRQAAAQASPYQVALVDLSMPEMDGMALAQAVRLDPAILGVRLVLMSSLDRTFTADELGAAGFAECLVKPVRQSALYDGLIRALGKAAQTASEPRRDGPVQGNAARRFFRVLVVEDNAVNQKVAVRQVHKLGYEADVAANGLEALEALRRIPYDLVFMDCQMPEMDGFQATAEIRKLEGDKKHTPIVAMTANALEGDREKCLLAGMDGYISKPVRIRDLEEVLARWDVVVDAAALTAIRELGGADDPGFLDGLISDFREDSSKQLEALRGAVQSGNAKALELAAHALKGSSGNMGVRRMQALCLRLESIGKSGAVEGTAGLMEALEGELVRAKAALEAEQSKRSSGGV